MKILLLGPYREDLIEFLKTFDDIVLHQEEKVDESKVIQENVDFIISYGYRYLLSKNLVHYYDSKIINLHISYLPWNKGADPNLWSFLEDTPKGVTIHYIDTGLDTGDIIAQKAVHFSEKETLASSYQILIKEIESLFKKVWPQIRAGSNSRITQTGKGSCHSLKDKEKYRYLLTSGWDTPINQLIKAAK